MNLLAVLVGMQSRKDSRTSNSILLKAFAIECIAHLTFQALTLANKPYFLKSL